VDAASVQIDDGPVDPSGAKRTSAVVTAPSADGPPTRPLESCSETSYSVWPPKRNVLASSIPVDGGCQMTVPEKPQSSRFAHPVA
jgi:hypothetical protein